ncbi:capsular biosynthesis protein [Pseudoflavitalea sp. G-6-1-2]|uniref:sugar transferase n=1 Tax=Pseudoflavitalea sp. G-6-1-2 TaxID=2728841 RepID=UPI00146CFDAB|nr:sugar transferase [Pseudoflavitalea sp. G-6-1-2]NML20617.1 capsular biosynthesis protein [Pseudoflavitalea sp. G-6-1-2]
MIILPKPVHSFTRKTGIKAESITLRSYVEQKQRFLVVKRIFDIFFSSLIIVFVLSWLFPIIAILIKLDSNGPVFFVQRRVGRWGKSFKCLKFRTMVVNVQANTKQAADGDARITRIGKFLRKSNLDEFPQFFNVLSGQMSVVGPRPHMHADCNAFSSVISNYKFRNMMKPGITGLAQVRGYRGPTKNFESIFHRYQFDAFYVRNANFWLDMRIVRKTAAQTFQLIFSRIFNSGEEVMASTTSKQWIPSVKNLN